MPNRHKDYQDVSGSTGTDGKIRQLDRSNFYLYCRQQGLWPKEGMGFDPAIQDESHNQLTPVRNVTKDCPPTLQIHGINDTDVPYEQSAFMIEQFKQHDVKHRLITTPNAGHGIRDGGPELVNQAYEDAVAFVKKHLPT